MLQNVNIDFFITGYQLGFMGASIGIENKEILTIYVQGGTKAKLQEIGKREGQSSVSALVRRALIEFIQEQEVSEDARPE